MEILTMNTNPTARRVATIEGWLHQPTSTRGQPSEGHTSAVNVLRMVNSRHQHQAAEPVPFRAKPAPLRSIKPCKAERRAQGCAGNGGACISHPDCPDVHCEGHPDNMGTAAQVDPMLRATVLRFAIAGLVAFWAAVAWAIWSWTA
jgi:hypothetical protein